MGGDFYKLRALRVLRRKYAAALDGHADGARGAGKLIKCVDTLFIRIFSQQQPNVLPPRGADTFRIALRAGEKLPGLQERAANLVVNAGLGAQNLLFPRRFLYVLPILGTSTSYLSSPIIFPYRSEEHTSNSSHSV